MEQKKQIDFIWVWFAKCWTTYIAKLLSEHPDIFIPESKELNFFSPVKKYYTNSEDLLIDQYKEYWIKKYFNSFNFSNENKIKWEYSTHYNNSLSAKRIKENFPNIKILISIRNPINRSLSSYNFFDRNNWSFEKSFLKNKDIYTNDNSYYETVKIYYELFWKENVKVIIFEDFTSNPLEWIKNIYNFLWVKSDFIPNSINKTINKTTVPKNKIIYNFTIKILNFSEKIKKYKFWSNIINILKSFWINKILDIFLKRTEKKYSKKIPNIIKNELLNFYIEDSEKLGKIIWKDLINFWWLNK